jgi:hypothetical protein
MQPESLYDTRQPLMSDIDSNSEDGGSWLPSSSDDSSSSEGDCAMAWALPASAAASDIGWAKTLPMAPQLQLRGSGMKLRSRLLLFVCMLCMMVALAAAVMTIAWVPAALTPLEHDAGGFAQESMCHCTWSLCPACTLDTKQTCQAQLVRVSAMLHAASLPH